MPEKDDKGLRNAGIRQLPLTYQTIFLQMMMFLVSTDIISAAPPILSMIFRCSMARAEKHYATNQF